MATLAPPYAPRRPTETLLYGVVREQLETFVRWARETYDKPLPRYVENELRAYLRCGVFAHGFLRAHCDACGHDLLLAVMTEPESVHALLARLHIAPPPRLARARDPTSLFCRDASTDPAAG